MKNILKLTAVLFIVLLMCSCGKIKADTDINGTSTTAAVTTYDISLDLTTKEKVEHAKVLAQKTEDVIIAKEEEGSPYNPPAEFIEQAKEKVCVPKVMLELEIEDEPMHISSSTESYAKENMVGLIYFNLGVHSEEYLKYKNYDIAYIASEVCENFFDYGESGNEITVSEYVFDENQFTASWKSVPAENKISVDMGIHINKSVRIGAILFVNGETEMTEKLAKQLYEDFRGIPVSELKNAELKQPTE